MALLSVMGLYQYDPTIFDTMELPDGIVRETMISEILTECAELECVIPDPDVFKTVINYWSKKNLQPWQKMYEAQLAEYNPLWNKDGTYTETETRNLSNKNTETRNLASTGESTGQVSAFNTNDFQNQNKQKASGTDKGTIQSDGTDSGTIKRERREYGNIGVTTSTAMLTEEMEFRSKYNVYDIILDDFKSRFCILVY